MKTEQEEEQEEEDMLTHLKTNFFLLIFHNFFHSYSTTFVSLLFFSYSLALSLSLAQPMINFFERDFFFFFDFIFLFLPFMHKICKLFTFTPFLMAFMGLNLSQFDAFRAPAQLTFAKF